MSEDFVTFELAKKLKEKGFWYTTDTLYFKDGGIGVYVGHKPCHEHGLYSRPTIAQVLKWLREEKKIHLFAEIADRGWYYTICPNIRIEK